MADKKSTIIIKKVKKGHGGHHGGAWKVAFADFVLAMMAFFLLMWLLAMVSDERKAVLAEYFREFNLFEAPGRFLLIEGERRDEVLAPIDIDIVEHAAAILQEDLMGELKKAIKEKLTELRDQVIVDVFEGGVRIQLVDVEGREMFRLGSAEPTPDAKEILKVVSENIRDIPNRIAIEGHTDAVPFRVGRITNWELSTNRASSVRRELEANGVVIERIARIAGYADTRLLIKENPYDPRNRRISILVLYERVQQLPQPLRVIKEGVETKTGVVQPAQPEPEAIQPVRPEFEDPDIKPEKPIAPIIPW